MTEFLSLLLRVIYRNSHSLTNSIQICRKGILTPLAMLPNPVMPNRLLQSNRNAPKIRRILRFVQPFETQTKSLAANTFSAWMLGFFFITVGGCLNMFLSVRSPAISFPSIVVQLSVSLSFST
ncbi:hypothetical protein I7I50_00580 [Histoplasma capsulatum G186AR]|uniref:Uncharacterized protein n=1 Tax=Ajellomyces capsulatus TaxID=5037 RepID=A0A8H8CV03_AJECA|nr:hypothetical protein I7I52_07848 [Histoplasma capsulatum]QSS72662.1 hypothetical protein I7I50_00580 [Histoplasma capsulatum G186AR]